MVSLPLDANHFEGGANLTPQNQTDLRNLINQLAFERIHEPVVAPGKSGGPPGQNPEIESKEALSYLTFSVDIDSAYRLYKIPGGFIGEASAHVHWTKSQDTDQSGKAVRWRLTYKVFNGYNEDGANDGAITVDLDDTYDDAGTTTRIVYGTLNVPLAGFLPRNYLSMKIEAVTPGGIALVEPGLVALDIVYLMQRGTI